MPFEHLPLDKVRPAEGQPRKTFYQESLEELAASIKERGVLEPIVVRPHPSLAGHYEIIMGERRWRASRIAGMQTIPAIIRELSDEDAQVDALLENFQREDLNPIEKARAIQGLLQFYSYEKTAKALGVSETTIRRSMDLLELPASVQAELIARPNAGPVFNESHARVLLTLNDDPALQARLVQKVKADKLSVANLEKLLEAIKAFPTKREVFLHVSVSVTEQMVRSLKSREDRAKPYKSQTAKDHLKGIDRQVSGLADLLDARVVDFLSAEEMNQLLATMAQIQKQIDQFNGNIRQALERKDFGFREVYIHCPLCGRIELVGAIRCSVCWTVLRRCIDCGNYDSARGQCVSTSKAVNAEEAENPRESSASYRCGLYQPKFTPKGMPLPVTSSNATPRSGMMRKF